jgi:carbon-monoxide dehydrogenase small subunit
MPWKVRLSKAAGITVHCTVNGKKETIEAHPLARLLDVLREDLKLIGAKEGCGEGECGACAVLVNGEVVNSCLVPIAQLADADVVTVEGIAATAYGQRLQKAFIQCGGAQCGICTPGMIVAAANLLQCTPNPSEEDLRNGLSGNLCRCTGYTRIFEAILSASQSPPSGGAN